MTASTDRSIAVLEAVDHLLGDGRQWGKRCLDRVDARGHHHYCIVGAAHHVAPQVEASHHDLRVAMAAVRRHCGALTVRGFNDRPATTIRDVRRVLREAMAELGGATPRKLEARATWPAATDTATVHVSGDDDGASRA